MDWGPIAIAVSFCLHLLPLNEPALLLRRPNVRVRPKPALLFHSLLHVALCHVRLST